MKEVLIYILMAVIIIGLSIWSYLRGKEKGYEEGFDEAMRTLGNEENEDEKEGNH